MRSETIRGPVARLCASKHRWRIINVQAGKDKHDKRMGGLMMLYRLRAALRLVRLPSTDALMGEVEKRQLKEDFLGLSPLIRMSRKASQCDAHMMNL